MKYIVLYFICVYNITTIAQDARDSILKTIWSHDMSGNLPDGFHHVATGDDYSVLVEDWCLFWIRINGTQMVKLCPDEFNFDGDEAVVDIFEISDTHLAFTSGNGVFVEIKFDGKTMITSSYELGTEFRGTAVFNIPIPKVPNPFLGLQDGKLTLYRYVPSAERQSSNKEPAAFHVDKTTFAAESGKNYVEFNATVTPNQTYSWSFSDDLKSWTELGELTSKDGNLWLRVENKQGHEYIKVK